MGKSFSCFPTQARSPSRLLPGTQQGRGNKVKRDRCLFLLVFFPLPLLSPAHGLAVLSLARPGCSEQAKLQLLLPHSPTCGRRTCSPAQRAALAPSGWAELDRLPDFWSVSSSVSSLPGTSSMQGDVLSEMSKMLSAGK